ncbi:MAG: TrpB-like pyridoxal phosphate-dependent enzyme [Candidatus Thermoplasmatota archaeon]|nr:TrpB-like pyridoxal phosphate-dependent enzyme [Candidatus Thermoplasmatota archaeon]
MMESYREEIIPENWYNVVPDLPEPLPPPKSESEDRSSIEFLNRILPAEVLRQEFTFSRYEKIPEEVREMYRIVGRPTPLIRASLLEKKLNYSGKIYLKYEGATVTGSHKINTALPQAFYASREGVDEVVTETGAGQWGTATALAAAMNGISSKVFMVRVSYDQKPLRKTVMNIYGSSVVPSPSMETEFGRKILDHSMDHPGSLGIAISEAVEYALTNNKRYLLGSVMNSVLTHQSVIGQETIRQIEIEGIEPDVLIGCVGGGSNFGGFVFPFLKRFRNVEMIASTASEVPKFSKGSYKYDFIDTAGILPRIRMYSLGSDFVPSGIYAGGLRYHGAAPSLSLLVKKGRIKSEEVSEPEVKDALRFFAAATGIVAAPESGHAIATALRYVKGNLHEKRNIIINVSGHGNFDLSIFNR